jgi:hypothetical protein
MKNRSLIDITRDLALAKNEYEIFNEEDLMKKVDEFVSELYSKEDGIYWMYNQIEGEISLFKDQVEKLTKHVKMLKNAQERIKGLVVGSFQSVGQLPAHSVFNPVKIGKSSGAVDVIDEEKIPDEYWIEVTNSKLDKKRILVDLKDGNQIPGVRLVQKEFVRGLK